MSLAHIAARAGVAKGTASKALNHYPGISAATRERVWEAARSVGALPRRYRTAAGDADRTVLLLPMVESLFRELQKEPGRLTAQAYHSFQQSLTSHGYDLLLGPAGQPTEQAIQYVRTGIGKRFGAVALTPPVDAALATMLHRRRIPSVCLSGSADETSVSVITADHAQGTRLVLHHLLELGHRRIGYLNSGLRSRSHLDRLQAFLLEMRLTGLPCPNKWIMQPPLAEQLRVHDRSVERWHDEIGRFLNRLVQRDDLPTAFVCVNDDFARKVIELLSGHGLSVPEDLSVTGWGNELALPITSVKARPAQVGELGARWLIAQMRDHECSGGRLLVPVDLAIRGSTAPPRS